MLQNVFPANSSASVYVYVCLCVCDTCRHAAGKDKAQLLLLLLALLLLLLLALLRRHVSVAAAGNGVNVNVDAKISGRHSSSCVCVIPCEYLCTCVCVCVCCGVWGVTCACVVSSSTFMSLVSLGLCWSLAVASRARLQSFIIKIFCTRIFINCFVSHPPQHTHTQTHPAHPHMYAWGKRHFYEANLMLSFFISHFCCAIFSFYSLFGAPKTKTKMKMKLQHEASFELLQAS